MPPLNSIRQSRWPLRLFRLGIFLAILVTMHVKLKSRHLQLPPIQLEEVWAWFPDAHVLEPDPDLLETALIRDSQGQLLGKVLSTYPQAQSIVGYAGPTECLIALNLENRIHGIQIRRSADTTAHLETILTDPTFLKSWNLRPWLSEEQDSENKPEANFPDTLPVSGSTLTSLAIIEGVLARQHANLDRASPSGTSPTAEPGKSLRFPRELTLENAQQAFPDAARLEKGKWGAVEVFDASGNSLGSLVRSSPASDGVAGHQGPSDTVAALDADEKIQRIFLHDSFDTEQYVEKVKEDEFWATVLNGKSLEELAEMELKALGLEGVAGATQTSYAMAQGLRLRAKQWVEHRIATKREEAAPNARAQEAPQGILAGMFGKMRSKDWTLIVGVLGALLMTYSHLKGRVWVRRSWSVIVILWFGIWNADFLSLSLWRGWIEHGLPWRQMPGMVLLTVASILIPWGDGKHLYCHHFCPHGMLQGWIGSLRKPMRLSSQTLKWFEKIPWIVLCLALISLLFQLDHDFSQWEAFDAWVPAVAGWGSIALALLGLLLSAWIPHAYCRMGCATGSVFKFLRTSGGEHFGRRDLISLILLVCSVLIPI